MRAGNDRRVQQPPHLHAGQHALVVQLHYHLVHLPDLEWPARADTVGVMAGVIGQHRNGQRPRRDRRFGDPDAEPVSDAYARLSPDGADHWPIVLRRLQRMWAVEPSFTREQLQRIKAPTLVIVGDGDIVTPEHAVEMFRTIPAAQLCVVPHSGHGVMPKETILAFLNEVPTDAK